MKVYGSGGVSRNGGPSSRPTMRTATHHMTMSVLPVWQVQLNDADRSDVYFDPVAALPLAVVA